MEIVDVRGLSCPIPVIRTKKIIDKGFTEIKVLGDNAVSCENVSRLARNCGYNIEFTVEDKNAWEIILTK
ncbi:MAG TPA: sulfurtransferase TusA family protein [Syntrophomonadaceae bacterium]|nr:sulfurtransferase TusA family protein [Syntrophomonadaceae bacterium]